MKNISSTSHLGYVEALRGLAALYVVMHHIILQFGTETLESLDIFSKFFVGLFELSHYAVDLFIVISGFCLMLPVVRNGGRLKGNVIIFFQKRIRRILPPYYLAMGLSLLLIFTIIGKNTGTHWDKTIPVTPKDVFTHLILIQDIFRDTSAKINHSFWSISVEWRIYFLFPLIVWAWRRFGSLVTVVISIVVSYFILFALKFSSLNTSPWGICPHYIGLFTLGMLAAEISYGDGWLSRLKNKLPLDLITILIGMSALVAYEIFWKTGWWSLADLLAGICASCLLIRLASNDQSKLYKALSWKPLIFIGTFAYSLYLMHAPLLQVMWQYFIEPFSLVNAPVLIPFLIMLLPSVVTSYLFFLVCERPFLRKSTK